QIEKFRPPMLSVPGMAAAESLRDRTHHLLPASRPRIVVGVEGMIELATLSDIDLVVSAVVGVSGLIPTLEAIGCGKTIALANKEIMVVAGEMIKAAACR